DDLTVIGAKYRRLLREAHSTTRSLQIASHSKLPGTLVFALMGMAVHGFEPVSLRYFVIEAGGALRYLDAAELEDRAAARRREQSRTRYRSRGGWREQAAAFASVEILFRRVGSDEPA